MIPYGRQSISPADIEAVVAVLRSDWLTQGPAVPAFERSFADYVGAAAAVAVNSGTSALHLAYLSVGLAEGDLLWTSPVTFVASANAALYCGADVDFVDIDPMTACMSADALEEKLAAAERAGRLPKVLVPVHMAGQPCDMERISRLAEGHGICVIEDACHAAGAEYRGGMVGSCSHSRAAVFSFHPVKVLTTGEGGAVTTNDTAVAERVDLLRTHGITRDVDSMVREPDGPWYYEQVDLGYNFRMSDIHAALGSSQLARIGEFLERRRELADRYDRLLAGLPLSLPVRVPQTSSAWHLYVVRLRSGSAQDRRRVVEMLRANGVGAHVHYIPVHLQPYYRDRGFAEGDFPASEGYYREAISLPLYHDLTDEQQDVVVAELKKALA